jgi:CBS domain containing-hemolysin-like protein
MRETLTWLGILLCIAQSGVFSGLNLAVFTPSRLRLETAAEAGDADAARVLALRRDANFTLVTILWGNLAINVLLTLLAESLLAGVAAFLFSTLVITFAGEIIPQAYFSRHALRMAARLSPLLRLYRVPLWPVARPVGKLLDCWVGSEGIPWLREAELRDLLRHHARSDDSEVGRLEATGAINFLALDDVPVGAEGEPLDPQSIVCLPAREGRPVFPRFERSPEDPFLRWAGSSAG